MPNTLVIFSTFSPSTTGSHSQRTWGEKLKTFAFCTELSIFCKRNFSKFDQRAKWPTLIRRRIFCCFVASYKPDLAPKPQFELVFVGEFAVVLISFNFLKFLLNFLSFTEDMSSSFYKLCEAFQVFPNEKLKKQDRVLWRYNACALTNQITLYTTYILMTFMIITQLYNMHSQSFCFFVVLVDPSSMVDPILSYT